MGNRLTTQSINPKPATLTPSLCNVCRTQSIALRYIGGLGCVCRRTLIVSKGWPGVVGRKEVKVIMKEPAQVAKLSVQNSRIISRFDAVNVCLCSPPYLLHLISSTLSPPDIPTTTCAHPPMVPATKSWANTEKAGWLRDCACTSTAMVR